MSKISTITALSTALVFTSMAAMADTWQVPGDFATIQDANDSPSVIDGDRILIGPGDHAGALVSKSLEIKGEGGATIVDGPVHGSGLLQGFRLIAGSDGATISHLHFSGVDLAIMNGGSVDDVTVTQASFDNTVQAVSNWRGNGWEISHNVITDLRSRCGGGIGILIADFQGGVVRDNVVSHNKISGTLHVSEGDCGGYSGTGIVLYADFRWNREGADEIRDNRVVKNKVSLVSDNEDLVPVVAIELTEASAPDSDAAFIFDNAIGFNDLRGTVDQIALTPESLADVNKISRNLGNNRGHGLHPSIFQPGGN